MPFVLFLKILENKYTIIQSVEIHIILEIVMAYNKLDKLTY